MTQPNLQKTMPALALRGLTVFPNMLIHFDVGREASIKALDEAMTSGQPIFLVAQRDLTVEDPQEKDLYSAAQQNRADLSGRFEKSALYRVQQNAAKRISQSAVPIL